MLLLLLFDVVDGGWIAGVVVAVAVPPNRADRFATGAFMVGLVLLVMEWLFDDGPFTDDDDNIDAGLLLAAGFTWLGVAGAWLF